MDLEQTAIERLKMASHMSEKIYHKPLIVTISGGKDSSVVMELARRAGVPFEVQHNHTTADAPETVYFVRSELKRMEAAGISCMVKYPTYKGKRTSMWDLIPIVGMPPTRNARYCCNILKENGNKGDFIVTGVRWAESKRRAELHGAYETTNPDKSKRIILNNDNDPKRQLFETCQLKAKRVCNPIIDWTDRDVWEFINAEHIPVNPLYGCGFRRVGCIGCPLASRKVRVSEFMQYPNYKKLYLIAFDRMLKEREPRPRSDKQLKAWETAEEVMHDYMEDGVIPGQMDMDEFTEAT